MSNVGMLSYPILLLHCLLVIHVFGLSGFGYTCPIKINIKETVRSMTWNQLYPIFGRSSKSRILMEKLFSFLRFLVYTFRLRFSYPLTWLIRQV